MLVLKWNGKFLTITKLPLLSVATLYYISERTKVGTGVVTHFPKTVMYWINAERPLTARWFTYRSITDPAPSVNRFEAG